MLDASGLDAQFQIGLPIQEHQHRRNQREQAGRHGDPQVVCHNIVHIHGKRPVGLGFQKEQRLLHRVPPFDKIQHQGGKDSGISQRNADLPKDLPGRCAVQLGRLEEFIGNILKAAGHDKNRERRKHPWQDDGQRRIVDSKACSDQVVGYHQYLKGQHHQRNVPEQQETPARKAQLGKRPRCGGGDHQLTGDLCKGQQAGVPEGRKKLRGVQQQLRQRLERRPGRQDRPHRIPAVCCVQQGRPQGGCQFVRRHQRTADGKPQRPKDGEGQQAKDQHRQKRLLFSHSCPPPQK